MHPFRRVVLNEPVAGPSTGPDVAGELVGLVKTAYWSHVDAEGGLDGLALRASGAWGRAEACARRLAGVDLGAVSDRPTRLAFWINVYNALVLHGIVALGLRRSVWEAWNFFGRISYRVGGVVVSADEVEHGILRGNRPRALPPWRPFSPRDRRLDLVCDPVDPRIHFAVNCGARSCPPVGVYRADVVDAQLDLAARSYVGQETSLAGDAVVCSRLFKWYRRDFEAAGGLAPFLLRYLDEGPVRAALAAGAEPCRAWRPYSWALPHRTAR